MVLTYLRPFWGEKGVQAADVWLWGFVLSNPICPTHSSEKALSSEEPHTPFPLTFEDGCPIGVRT